MGCLLAAGATSASAQSGPPLVALQQVSQHCTVSVLNRTVTANADGTWILPNVPANFGPVRARVTCIVNGQTISGESDAFTVPANGAVNIPQIHFGQTTPIPTALTIAPPAGPLTQAGGALQLSVTARYPDSSTRDVTSAADGTTYTVSNAAIATISGDGLVQAMSSGTVIVQASHEGASGMTSIRVALGGGSDTDGDGIPDEDELALGLDPNDAVDAQEDFDRDNLTNLREFQLGTDLRQADSDGDGLKDGDEVARGTNPLLVDTDGDGVRDGLEVQTGSDPLDPNSYNLTGALSSLAVSPSVFILTFNTIAGDVFVPLAVTGTLRDGTTIDLTSTQRGTNYASSNLSVCSFGAIAGRVFAGVSGGCAITAAVGGFSAAATGTVTTFAPTPLSFVELGGPGNGVDVAGDHVYVAAGAAGLKVIDVVNRSAPRVVATLALLGTANDVKISGAKAFVAAGAAGLQVVDIGNPLAPRLLGSVDTPGFATDVRVRGDLAHIADGSGGLQIVDVTNASAPRIVGSVPIPGGANGVDITDTLAVVAAGSSGIRIVNVANATSPIVVGALGIPGNAVDVVVRGSFAYVAADQGSLRAVDFTTPAAPVLGGTTPQALGGILLDVAMADTFVFGADWFFVNGVPIVDVSTPMTPNPRAILDFRQFRDDDGAGIAVDGSYVYLGTQQGRLYVGQYRIQQDLNGVPPTVSIVSPATGDIFVVGEPITVSVSASDDLAVTAVTLIVNDAESGLDTTAPHQFDIVAPFQPGTVTLRARARDLGNNVGVSPTVVVSVVPDPLTTVSGRVVADDGTPVSGATVTCAALSAPTVASGAFALANVPTVPRHIVCRADFVSATDVTLRGMSSPVPTVRGDVTAIGDIVLAPLPSIQSIAPKVIDATRPPSALVVTGINLSGATFRLSPDLVPSAMTFGMAQVNAAGTVATVPIVVNASGRGMFTLVGVNPSGGFDPTPSPTNRVTLFNVQDDGDSDGDGFPDGLELLFGSDPSATASVPDLGTVGNASATLAVLNTALPPDAGSQETVSAAFSVVNLTLPTDTAPQHTVSAAFSIANLTLPDALSGQGHAVSGAFSVVNTSIPSSAQMVVGPAVSILNSNTPVNLSSAEAASSLRTASAGAAAPAPLALALSLADARGREPLVQGQTVTLVATVSGGDGTSTVTFTVNGIAFAEDGLAPHELLFTVPAGISELRFGATARDQAGSLVTATPIDAAVVPDALTVLSGRVLDDAGNPVAGAVVDLLSEGLQAEFFDATAPLTALPDLAQATPQIVSRVTAINARSPGSVFGFDTFGVGLSPDYAARFTGWIEIREAGTYTFVLGADEGARLRLGGMTVVDMPTAAAGYQERASTVVAEAGLVPIEITFYESTGNAELQLSLIAPDGTRQVVAPSTLVPAAGRFVVVTDQNGRFTFDGVPRALDWLQPRATVIRNGEGVSGVSPRVAPPTQGAMDVGDIVVPATR